MNREAITLWTIDLVVWLTVVTMLISLVGVLFGLAHYRPPEPPRIETDDERRQRQTAWMWFYDRPIGL